MNQTMLAEFLSVIDDCRNGSRLQDLYLGHEIPQKKLANYLAGIRKAAEIAGFPAEVAGNRVLAFIETAPVGMNVTGLMMTDRGVYLFSGDSNRPEDNGFSTWEEFVRTEVKKKGLQVCLSGRLFLNLAGASYDIDDLISLLNKLRAIAHGKKVARLVLPDGVSRRNRLVYMALAFTLGAFSGVHFAYIRQKSLVYYTWATLFGIFLFGRTLLALELSSAGRAILGLGYMFFGVAVFASAFLVTKDGDGKALTIRPLEDCRKESWNWVKHFCRLYLLATFGTILAAWALMVLSHQWITSRRTLDFGSCRITLTKEEDDCRRRAERGDSDCQYRFAKILNPMNGVRKNVKPEVAAEAFKWALLSAKQGNGDGENYVGCAYVFGEGVASNATVGVDWFEKALEHGSKYAARNLADAYLHGRGTKKDFAKALKTAKQGASENSDECMLLLGRMYLMGDGVTKDAKEAFSWLEKSSALGNVCATMLLANMYQKGDGVNRDPTKSFDLWKSLADKGSSFAQLEVGKHYLRGIGIRKDQREAAKWIKIAAENGEADAQHLLGKLYWNGIGVKRDDDKSYEWFERAAENGCAAAYCGLAEFYKEGRLFERDESKMFELYQKSADAGCAEGQFFLGQQYFDGVNVGRDYAKAVELFKSSADNGFGAAATMLGNMYSSGKGVELDLDQAIDWYRRAVECGWKDAQSLLENAISKNDGHKRDKRIAEENAKRKAAEAEEEARKIAARKTCEKCNGKGAILEKKICDTCGGIGFADSEGDCEMCKGTGVGKKQVFCTACSGKGSVKDICTDCKGKGYVKCSQCKGVGSYYDRFVESRTSQGLGTVLATRKRRVKCESCSGSGKVKCACEVGYWGESNCPKCRGKGSTTSQWNCTKCNGAGKVTAKRDCPDCDDGWALKNEKCRRCKGRGWTSPLER